MYTIVYVYIKCWFYGYVNLPSLTAKYQANKDRKYTVTMGTEFILETTYKKGRELKSLKEMV